jgi:hypothetical protein
MVSDGDASNSVRKPFSNGSAGRDALSEMAIFHRFM